MLACGAEVLGERFLDEFVFLRLVKAEHVQQFSCHLPHTVDLIGCGVSVFLKFVSQFDALPADGTVLGLERVDAPPQRRTMLAHHRHEALGFFHVYVIVEQGLKLSEVVDAMGQPFGGRVLERRVKTEFEDLDFSIQLAMFLKRLLCCR